MARTELTATFQLQGDKFEHAWFFNRFRCDPLGGSILVTTALVSDTGGTPAVNGFVLSKADLRSNRERSLDYVSKLSEEHTSLDALKPLAMVPPERIYPVNHINLSRMDEMAEIGLFRYSIHTLLTKTKPTQKGEKALSQSDAIIPCYPVVMFRCDLGVQLSLIKELYSDEI
jgi:hypothetical protein